MSEKAKVETVHAYGHFSNKTAEISEMFDSIAPAYDFMNNAMTFGLCRYWRNRALDYACAPLDIDGEWEMLDVATGTGDVALELLRRRPNARIHGVDLSSGMLQLARQKTKRLGPRDRSRIFFAQGDSLMLPFPDNMFHLVTVAYGVRNFAHIDRGLAEMTRVLKPGGTLCIIELSEPRNPLTRALYKLYAHKLIPLLGSRVSGDKSAYTYLPASIAACPQRDDMTRLMTEAGLDRCHWRSLTFGAVTLYYGKKGL